MKDGLSCPYASVCGTVQPVALRSRCRAQLRCSGAAERQTALAPWVIGRNASGGRQNAPGAMFAERSRPRCPASVGAYNGVWSGADPHQTRSSNRLTVSFRLSPRRWASERNRDAVSQRRAIFVRC